MTCARPPNGMPKGPKKKKKKKITIDNTTLKHQNFRASNKERNFIQYIVSLHENWQVTAENSRLIQHVFARHHTLKLFGAASWHERKNANEDSKAM